jgi:hypothetical protein
MTNEELEQKVKRLEEQLTEVRIELLERKAPFIPYKPYEVEVPEDVEDYYYVDETGLIERLWVYDINEQIEVFKRGLAFKTIEEAKQFDKERILINKLKNWAKEHQEDWTPDWSNFNETKRYITCKKEQGEFDVNFCRTFRHFIKLPYFKSEEIAEQFIEEFGDEIKEVLC